MRRSLAKRARWARSLRRFYVGLKRCNLLELLNPGVLAGLVLDNITLVLSELGFYRSVV